MQVHTKSTPSCKHIKWKSYAGQTKDVTSEKQTAEVEGQDSNPPAQVLES